MKCTNPNCNYDVDGVCVDGFENNECPNLEDLSQVRLITPDSIPMDEDVDDDMVSREELKEKLCGQFPLSVDEVQARVRNRKESL